MSRPKIHPVNAIMQRERKRRHLIPAQTPHDSIIWERERFRILHDEKGKKITQRHCVRERSGSIFKVKTYKQYFLFPEKNESIVQTCEEFIVGSQSYLCGF